MLSQIATYHIFNYLVPGAIFAYFSQYILPNSLIQKNIVIGLILYYFIGLVISRIGSLVVEPLLKRSSIIRFESYNRYIEASKLDAKIDTISEENNTYRTFCSLFVSLIFLTFYEYIKSIPIDYKEYEIFVILIALFFLFLFSYRKQTGYIRGRINAALNEEK